MSTAMVPQRAVTQWESREMIETLKQTVAKGATDAQFKMFVEVCKATGLNPFLKEIWFVPNVGVMAGRDGYLRVANDHPMFDGMSTTVERDEKGVPIKATCSVWRKDRSHPITCEAFFDEYRKSSQVWQTYRSAMIGKVAEVLALKRSFSINGVVTEEEIGPQSSTVEQRCSVEEQQEIAGRKIKELSSAQPRPPSEDPTYEQRHTKMILEANAALDAPATETKPRGIISYAGLKKWGELKAELRQLSGTDAIYYAALKAKGCDHANQIANDKDVKEIWKVLSSERTKLKGESELKVTLNACLERLGGVRYLEILGANGCVSNADVLQLGGTPLDTLLSELKQAVDDLQPTSV